MCIYSILDVSVKTLRGKLIRIETLYGKQIHHKLRWEHQSKYWIFPSQSCVLCVLHRCLQLQYFFSCFMNNYYLIMICSSHHWLLCRLSIYNRAPTYKHLACPRSQLLPLKSILCTFIKLTKFTMIHVFELNHFSF